MATTAKFSSQITAYFGALLLAAMGILMSLWYFGQPELGLTGARYQRLAQAMHALEEKADVQRFLIKQELLERRGDLLALAETDALTPALPYRQAAFQRGVEQAFNRLQRAYPDHYRRLLVVDPITSVVLAGSTPDEVGRLFPDSALLTRATQPGAVELIEPWLGTDTVPALALVRQLHTRDASGYPVGKLAGILVVLIDLQNFVGAEFQGEDHAPTTGVTLLFDPAGQVLAHSAAVNDDPSAFKPNPDVAPGFEGTLLQTDALGRELIVVYRHVQLSGTQAWTLVHYLNREDALGELKVSANRLAGVGLILTLTTLLLVWLVARRLTRPLHLLSARARQLGAGDWSVRSLHLPEESQEMATLADAFNVMVQSIQEDRATLETKVMERTAELASERDRAQGYLDIAGVMLLALDRDGRIVLINKKGVDILGRPESELIGADWFANFVPPAELEQVREVFKRMMSGDTPWVGRYENRITNAAGEERVLSWNNTVVRDTTGALIGTLSSAEDITERKQAEEEIRVLAFYDSLTGLPNRRVLMDRLEQALASAARYRRKGALLFVDLDNFKTLNDTLGHDKGDLLLQQVAQRLLACTRGADTVARLGGDEFVVLLEDLSESALDAALQAEAVGEKMLEALNQAYSLAGWVHHSTPSIGVTLFGERHESIEEPLKRADLAMYQAKAAGRNTLRFFDVQTQLAVTARVTLEAALREALEKKQFVLYYQAQVIHDGHPTGAEVLVRWLHPERGMVSPAEFIPLAEETGLILPLGSWVMDTACKQLAAWATRPEMACLTLSVNVSVRQFQQRDFVDQVLAVLERTGADPHLLKLELTESLLVANVEDIIAKMTALKARGVGFSLDDFGTGYSSLSYLKRLPLDQLKIDQGFVRDILIDPDDAAIANMVIVLAGSLGLTVVAEGVETLAQRDFLARQGCHAYQGYLFSRPLPVLDYEAFIASNKVLAL